MADADNPWSAVAPPDADAQPPQPETTTGNAWNQEGASVQGGDANWLSQIEPAPTETAPIDWMHPFQDALIPFDEVLDAHREISESMPRELRCTALGGLSVTPTSKAIEQRLCDGCEGCG